MKNNKGTVLNQIRHFRKQNDLTQIDLAKQVGATRQTIIAIEAGKYAPSLELAFRIALILGQPFEVIFQFEP